MTVCDGCVYANWMRTKNGRLHPSKEGRCSRLIHHPIDRRLPAAFYWIHYPNPSGGFILRGEKHKDKCVFKTGYGRKV